MVMLDMFRGMNLWFNSFTFLKLGIHVCWIGGLLDVSRCYVVQVEARLYNGLYKHN
jgi:hypothetical protein